MYYNYYNYKFFLSGDLFHASNHFPLCRKGDITCSTVNATHYNMLLSVCTPKVFALGNSVIIIRIHGLTCSCLTYILVCFVWWNCYTNANRYFRKGITLHTRVHLSDFTTRKLHHYYYRDPCHVIRMVLGDMYTFF